MIQVQAQPEPAEFDTLVRQPGQKWIQKRGFNPALPLPKKVNAPNHWKNTQKALWDAYSGTCAYLAIHFLYPTGASSTDHFIAKSKVVGQIYEWSNYRLSTLAANRNKREFSDVLDPFTMRPDTFHLDLLTGGISPNPDLSPEEQQLAQATIDRLTLDDPDLRTMRSDFYSWYLTQDISANLLKKMAPFVHQEAERQGLL